LRPRPSKRLRCFLIAGDLFDRPQVEPPHLRQAQQVLVELKKAGIPVIAIEGIMTKPLFILKIHLAPLSRGKMISCPASH